MSKPMIVSLVPGDDWAELITVTNPDGSPVDYSGWTILVSEVSWSKGSIPVTVDLSQAGAGKFGISAAHAGNASLPLGPGSHLLIRGQSPAGKVETIYYGTVDGVKIKALNALSVVHMGMQGAPGVLWRGPWQSGAAYVVSDGVYLDGSSFRATTPHQADANSRPGSGAQWQNYWTVVALGANEADVGSVLANMPDLLAAPGKTAADRAVVAQDRAAADASASQAAINAALSIKTVGVRTVGNVVISGSGTPIGNTLVYFQPASVKDYDEFVTGLPVAMPSAGKLRIVVSRLEADGTFSDAGVAPVVVDAPAGIGGVTGLFISKPAGCAVGIQWVSGGAPLYTTGTIPGGEERWTTPTVPTSHTPKTVATSNGVQFQAILTAEVAAKARGAYDATGALSGRVDQNTAAIGGEQRYGWADPIVATGSATVAGYTIALQQFQAASNCRVSELTIGMSAPSTLKAMVVTMAGTTVSEISYSRDINVATGVNVLAVDIPMLAGQYLVISGANIRYQPNANPQAIPIWIRLPVVTSPPIAVGDALTSSTQHRFEIAFKVQSGIKGDVAKALAGGAGNSGLNLMAAADSTGVVDAASVFASAIALHPQPYVGPGKYLVSTILSDGNGYWGPGQVFAGGERFFMSSRPSLFNLYDAFRAKLAEHIANNDVLALISDSIGAWAYASSGSAHYFNRITRFANFGIAADEPGQTALRPYSTYFPSFYGVYYTYAGVVLPNSTAWAATTNYAVGQVVLSGGGTYLCNTAHTSGASFDATKFTLVAQTGSRGPLGESLILSDTAGISFAGTHEEIGAHYTQDAAQGSLVFAFNGTAFKTISAAGALTLDKYSGQVLTGQTGNGTYTITATGGPVELTGLIRLGVKVAGSRPRLRTLRAAHGSYTFASFNRARLLSIVAQCNYAGGKCVPVIPLGINDSFGTDPAVIAVNVVAALDILEGAGCDRIFVMCPLRPSAAWAGSYTGGRTYDAALGAIRKAYRGRASVQLIPVEGWDFNGAGQFQEGLHLNDAGNDGYAQRFIEHVSSFEPPAIDQYKQTKITTDGLDVLINGRMTGTKLVEGTGAGVYVRLFKNYTFTKDSTYKHVVTMKRLDRFRVALFSNGGAIFNGIFDLKTLTATGTGTLAVKALGNDWVELSVTVMASSTSGSNVQIQIYPDTGGPTYNPDNASSIGLARARMEENGVVVWDDTDFTTATWNKTNVTPVPNALNYIGALAPLLGLKSYDDGSASLVGVKWAALGSSITFYYATLLAGQTGMVLTNLAVSGSALGLSTTGYPSYGMSARIADIPIDTQLVTLEPGPNAFGAQETPLGLFGAQTYDTHFGSIWKAILDIRARVPNAKIVVFGTYSGGALHATHRLGRINGQGNTMDQFMRAERDVCAMLGVPFFDVADTGLGYATADLFTTDWLHLNPAGSLRYATGGSERLRRLVRGGLFVN